MVGHWENVSALSHVRLTNIYRKTARGEWLVHGLVCSIIAGGCLKAYRGQLFLGEDCRQVPEFGLHFTRIDDRIRDLLAKKFAISLPKPVNGHLERSL